MELLATIRPSDVDPDAPDFDYGTFRERVAGRAVMFDGDKVALIFVEKDGYYMLPGGGIDDDDMAAGLARELLEETGCRVDIGEPVGRIDVYIDLWRNKQMDYCYVARKVGDAGAQNLTEGEAKAGYKLVWPVSINDAIRLVKAALPQVRDGKLIQARDLLFLETAAKISAV